MESSASVRLRYEELLFYAACVSNCWSVCLCVCVCLEGRVCRRGGSGGGGMRVSSSWRWQLSRAMRLALRWCWLCRTQGGGQGGGTKAGIGGRLSEVWRYSKLLLKSLYFNSLTNSDTLLDCAFEPVYWIVDNVTHWFGVVSSLPSSWFPRLLLLSLIVFPSLTLPGVCLSCRLADILSCGHCLPVCPAHDRQHLPCTLDCVAPLLWPLASHYGGVPLLQSDHHLSRTPTKGRSHTPQRLT